MPLVDKLSPSVVRRSVKKVVAAALPYLHKDLRRAEDGVGYIGFLGVYDFDHATRVFRFVFISATDVTKSVAVYDILGRKIEVDAVALTESLYVDGVCTGAFSIRISRKVSDFYIYAEGTGVTLVDGEAIQQFCAARDLKMINPGIDERYAEWCDIKAIEEKDNGQVPLTSLDASPLISVITPIYKTPPEYLAAMLDSMYAQTYSKWEHVLVNASPDDARVNKILESLNDERFKIVTLDSNEGIAENTKAGIEVATGDYIAFADHDDTLSPRILEEYVHAINSNPEVDLIYCDEDSLSSDGNLRSDPIFKPNLNPDLLTSRNYFIHMLCVSRRAYEQITPYNKEEDGSQDYDLTLKVMKAALSYAHIPKVLYHWRMHRDSVNGGSFAAKPYAVKSSIRTLENHFRSMGIDAGVYSNDIFGMYEIDYPDSYNCDTSLIILSDDGLIPDELLESLKTQRTSILTETVAVNRVGLNDAVSRAEGDFIVVCDAHMRFVDGQHALGRLRDSLVREDLGLVSAKILSNDCLNLQVGLCVKDDSTVGYLNQCFAPNMGGGYNGCAECQCDYSAADLTCVAFRKADFLAAGGVSADYETDLIRAVDFSFGIRNLGKYVMVDGHSQVWSYADLDQLLEGAYMQGALANLVPLRNREDAINADLKMLWDKWGDDYKRDVLYNPNVTLKNSYFQLNI